MKEKIDAKAIVILACILYVFIALSLSCLAGVLPGGPDVIQVMNTSSKIPNAAETIRAIAGNVTQLNIFARSQTQSWQGYYGNISGSITLDDARGNTVYSWQAASPSGQIFAATGPVDFTDGNVECYNMTKTDESYLTLRELESSFGIPYTATDGINETFDESVDYDPFYVGWTKINSTCPVVYLFNNSNESSRSTYQELLLYDKNDERAIFTALINPSGIAGFNGERWDFEMIVAENGRNADIDTTTYYFYVALE